MSTWRLGKMNPQELLVRGRCCQILSKLGFKKKHCSFSTSRGTAWESVSQHGPLALLEPDNEQTPSPVYWVCIYMWELVFRKHWIHWEETWSRPRESIGALSCSAWGQGKDLELVGFLGKQGSFALFCGGLSTSLISPGKGHVCVRYLFSLLSAVLPLTAMAVLFMDWL